MERSAAREAAGYYEQALATLAHLPPHRALQEHAIDLQLDLRTARAVLGQHARILDDLRTAATLAEALGDPRRLGRIAVYMADCFTAVGQYASAIASGQRALALATASGDSGTQVWANHYLSLVYFIQGAYGPAMDAFRRTVAALEGEQRYERSGQNVPPAVFSHTFLTLCLAEVDAFAEGRAVGDAGLRMAEAVKHPVSLVSAYRGVGQLALRQGNLPQALLLLERAAGLCEDTELPFHFSLLAPALGAAYVLCGRVDEAMRLLEPVLEQTTLSGRMNVQAPLLATLGEAHLRAGRLEEARTLATRALEYARTYQGRGNQASILRLLGEIAAHRDPLEVEEAAAHYQQALALAGELGMRPLQAHCHRGLGMLYAATGEREQAGTEISTARAMYQEMDMTFWLPETEAALAQVEAR
jgi:tetratricopeptide (TPR) repeat protein